MSADAPIVWLLDDLVSRVPGIQKALVLTNDGLAAGASAALGREEAERLAAIAAAFNSLARGAVRQLGAEQARQVIVEMDAAFLFITATGGGTCLAVVASVRADVGLIAYEMAMLIRRVNDYLIVRPRSAPGVGEFA